MPNKTETTQREFELFKKEFWCWIKEFGLIDWEVEITHETITEAKAKTYWVGEGKIAKVVLSKDWSDVEKNDYLICKVAFHECCEILLSEISEMANKIDESKTDRFVHSIIHRLQHVIFKPKTLKE